MVASRKLLAELKSVERMLEDGREDDARQRLAALAEQDAEHLRSGVRKVARALHEGLDGLPVKGKVTDLSSRDFADAGARLEHVVKLTEDAANSTLDRVDEARALLREDGDQKERMRAILSEISEAQAFQDLSGQILRRVSGLLSKTEQALSELLGHDEPSQVRSPAPNTQLGTKVPGLDQTSSQAEADDLLSGLGL